MKTLVGNTILRNGQDLWYDSPLAEAFERRQLGHIMADPTLEIKTHFTGIEYMVRIQ